MNRRLAILPEHAFAAPPGRAPVWRDEPPPRPVAPPEVVAALDAAYQMSRLRSARALRRRKAVRLRRLALSTVLVLMVSGLTGLAVHDRNSSRGPGLPEAFARLTDGDKFLDRGDFNAARVSYARALALGEAAAALRLGRTYDPHVISDMKIEGLTADRDMALRYYRQAAEAGIAEAQLLMIKLQRP